MPTYGQRYTASFSALSNASINYELQIWQKNYSGSVTPITLGADACVQEWVDDEYLKEIKSSFLKINLINDGTISLENFYSSFDDDFLVYLYRTDVDYTLLFSGYLSFDDLQDLAVAYNHDFYLVATDGLSFLKEIPFNKAAILNGTEFTDDNLNVNLNGSIIKINDYIYPYINIKAGSYVTVQVGTATYPNLLVNEVGTALGNPSGGPTNSEPYVYIDVAYNFSPLNDTDIDLTYTIAYDIDNKYLKLSEIFKLCLKSLPITKEEFRVIGNLKPYRTDRLLDETYLHVSSFIDNGSYLDCYTIIENICKSLSAVLMSNGQFYYLVRWGELPTHISDDNLLRPVHRYDSDFNYIISGTEDLDYSIGTENTEVGIIKTMIKPYTYVKTILKYISEEQNLLYNGNLAITLILLYEWTSGIISNGSIGNWDYVRSYLYESEGFSSHVPNTQYAETNANILVKKELYGLSEIERVLSIPYVVYTTGYHSVKCNQIPIVVGDRIQLQFEIRTIYDQYEPSSYMVPFNIILSDGTNTYYGIGNRQPKFGSSPVTYLQAGQWYQDDPTILYNKGYEYRGDEDYNAKEWQTIYITLDPAPITGNLIFCFTSIANGISGNDETFFKNIKCVKNGVSAGFGIDSIEETARYVANNNLYFEKESPYGYMPNSTIKNNFFYNGDNPYNTIKVKEWNYIPYPNDYISYNVNIRVDDTIWFGRTRIKVYGQNYTGNPPISNYHYPPGTEFTITNSAGGFLDGTYVIENIGQTETEFGIESFIIFLETELPDDTLYASVTLNFPRTQLFPDLQWIDARELMLLRSQPATKLELNILNMAESTIDLTALNPLYILSWVNTDGFDLGVFYIIGSLEVNYRTNQAKCTLYGFIYELDRTYEQINSLITNSFKYIYK